MTRDNCDCGYSFTNDDYLNAGTWTIECPKCGAEYYYEGTAPCCWALSGHTQENAS